MALTKLESPNPETPASDVTEASRFVCDLCSKSFAGTPWSSGLFMWTRGDEVRTEEPPLCEACANRLTLGAVLSDAGLEGEE